MMIRLLILSLLLLPATGQAATVATEISASKLEVLHSKSTALFSGKVRLSQGAFVMTSDSLRVWYADKKGGLQKAEATGHVEIRQNDTSGRGDKALLDQSNDTVTLSGNATLTQPGRSISGDRIIHYLKAQQTTVQQGSSGRVQMHIDSEEALPGKTEKP